MQTKLFKATIHLKDGGLRSCMVNHLPDEAMVRRFIDKNIRSGALGEACAEANVVDVVITAEESPDALLG